MKVALINPGDPRALRKENLGLASLAACIQQHGHTVTLIDEVAGQDTESALDAFHPDVAGISFMTMFAPRAYAIADAIREQRGIPVILGGAHPSALPEEALRHGDCVVRGEGEISLPRILDSGQITGIAEPEPPMNLDDLPLPRRDLLNLDFYAAGGDEIAGHTCRTLGIITSRGCPYRCTFCINSLRETCLRYHSPERVLEELRILADRYQVEGVAFYDEMIASDPVRFAAICEGMAREGLNRLKWECQIHPRSVKPDLLDLMREAGCLQVAIGFESGSQRILDAIGKNTLVEQNLEVAAMARKAGLRVRGCFILGTPGETDEDIRATEHFIQQARIDFASLHFLTPMPGTVLFDQNAGKILESNPDWGRWTSGDPGTFLCNDAMSPDEQQRAFLRLSAKLAFQNYTWKEMLIRALREPRRAFHVALQRFR